MNKLALLLLLALPGAALADARDPVILTSGEGYDHPAIDSGGDLTAVLWSSRVDELQLQVSDGRGLSWSPPVFVDRPQSYDEILYRQPRVVGNRAFLLFADERHDKNPFDAFQASTVFLRVYDHTIGSLGPELQLPTGIQPDHLTVSSYDFVAQEVGGAVHLHVALAQHELDPVTGRTDQQVVLYSSHDAGASWLPPLEIGPLGRVPMGKVRVLADGGQVSVVFQVGRPGTAYHDGIYHQRSLNGGWTADFPRPRLIPGTRFGRGEFDVDLRGSVFAVAYQGKSNVRVWAATSTDGGVHFHGRTNLKNPLAINGVKEHPRVAIAGDGKSVCAVARCSEWAITAVSSADSGVHWSPPEHVTSYGQKPELLATGSDRDRFVVIYPANPGGAASHLSVVARLRFEHDTNFGLPIEVLPDGSGAFSVAWNDRYQNALVGYGTAFEQSVGGLRPQEIGLHGIAAGSTAMAAKFSGFDGGADQAWLLLSTSDAGLSLPPGDGRDMGVGASPLLDSSLTMAHGGAFWVPLGPDGIGWTHQVGLAPPGIPAGLTLYAVGLSFDLDAGRFVDISDVVRIDT